MTNEATPLKFYTTSELAQLLKMNAQVIAKKLKHGELRGYKLGKDWRVKESDLLEWLERYSNEKPRDPRQTVLDRFGRDGYFEVLPAQRKRQRYIVEFILERFELGRVYTEQEVNEIIRNHHHDYCRIRRDFVDEGMMTRKDGKYARNAGYATTNR